MYERYDNGIFHNWPYLIGDIVSIELALLLAFILRSLEGAVMNAWAYIRRWERLSFSWLLSSLFSEKDTRKSEREGTSLNS